MIVYIEFSDYFNDQIMQMIKVIYQDQWEGYLPKLNATDFIKFIESCDSKLQGFFDILFKAMNLKGKN
jgi:hypothetical protein